MVGPFHAFDLGGSRLGGLFVGVELGLDSFDGVFVCVGGCVWDDEGVASGVVAVMVGVDEGEVEVFWVWVAGEGFGILEEGAGEVDELGVDEEDLGAGGEDEGVASGVGIDEGVESGFDLVPGVYIGWVFGVECEAGEGGGCEGCGACGGGEDGEEVSAVE